MLTGYWHSCGPLNREGPIVLLSASDCAGDSGYEAFSVPSSSSEANGSLSVRKSARLRFGAGFSSVAGELLLHARASLCRRRIARSSARLLCSFFHVNLLLPRLPRALWIAVFSRATSACGGMAMRYSSREGSRLRETVAEAEVAGRRRTARGRAFVRILTRQLNDSVPYVTCDELSSSTTTGDIIGTKPADTCGQDEARLLSRLL